MTTPPLPSADAYWTELTARRGVGQDGYAVLGGSLRRPFIRHFDTIAGAGVLESLIGASSSTGLTLWGRRQIYNGQPEWFHLDIAPAFNTWETEYERSPADANHGPGGLISESGSSAGPMPRAHIKHPSSLVYFERFPMWGGIRHNPDDYLPGPVEVLWQETAEATPDEPDWHTSPTPGDVTRVNLTNGAHPDLDGTAVFDLRRRLCLFFEIRHSGEPSYRLVVDALKGEGPATAFTEIGDRLG